MSQRQPSRHKALPPTLEAGGVNWKQVSSVRHRIEHQQQTIDMPNGPTISLRWQANTGSTFGPRSSAADADDALSGAESAARLVGTATTDGGAGGSTDDNTATIEAALAEKLPQWVAQDLVPNEQMPFVF